MIRMCALLSLMAALSGPPQDVRLVTHFCPECWRFAPDDGEWSRDESGRCWTCGKPPVEVEAAILQWWWCSRQSMWLRSPCPEAGAACCVLQTARAAVASAGERPGRARFCPECATFESLDTVPLRCRDCGRPSVRAESVDRTWVWCRAACAWRDAPCAANVDDACCDAKSGRLLAFRAP